MSRHAFASVGTTIAVAVFLAASSLEAMAMSTHPRLFATPASVILARKRVKEASWAKGILERLAKDANALSNAKLPVFEKDWWQESSKKRWQDTYPEINRHTMFAVIGPVTKAASAATAYAATGNKRYAEAAERVLLHYCGYEFFAEHPDVGLNWSVWCMQLLQSYDLIYDTIDDTGRARIDDFFRRAMEAVHRNDDWWVAHNPGGLYNNHFAWHKLFIGAYGLFYDKPELVDFAINSDQGIRDLIENGTRDDGLWFEGSINYHFTAVVGLVQFAMTLENSGSEFDLWRHRFANGRSLKELFTGPIGVLFPDETIPTIGDTYAHRVRLGSIEWYYAAYDAYQSPDMAWVLRNNEKLPARALFLEHVPGKSAPAPELKSRIWPEHGYVALRSQEGRDYWNGEGYSAFLSFDTNGIHSHHDKFDLMAFGRGAHIAADVEALASAQHAFSSDIQNQLNRTTLCHNTVMVDGKNHQPIPEKLALLDFVDNDSVKMATFADMRGMVSPGVKMMRTVAVTPDFVLDVFQLSSEDEHSYEYLFHTYADTGTFEPREGSRSMDLGTTAPWKWLSDARETAVDEDWSAVALQGKLATRISMLGVPGTRLITCRFPSKDTMKEPSIPMLIARRQAKGTVFAAVLQAERGDMPKTKISVSDQSHALLRVTVQTGQTSREFSLRKLAAPG